MLWLASVRPALRASHSAGLTEASYRLGHRRYRCFATKVIR